MDPKKLFRRNQVEADRYTEESYDDDQYDEDDFDQNDDMDAPYEEEQYEEAESDGEIREEERMDAEAENDFTYFLKLIDYMDQELQNSRAVPFQQLRLVDVDKCMDIMSQMKESIPIMVRRGEFEFSRVEMQREKAERIIRDHIVSQEINHEKRMEQARQNMRREEEAAKQRAKRIVEDAQREADNMVKAGVINSRIQEEIDRRMAECQTRVDEMYRRANSGCFKMVNDLAQVLEKMDAKARDMLAEYDQ